MSSHAQKTKRMTQRMVNIHTELLPIFFCSVTRYAVRGLWTSYDVSTNRLKDIAALRAVISAARINNNCFRPGIASAARNALITAKGNENMVRLNLIKLSIEVIFFNKPSRIIVAFHIVL